MLINGRDPSAVVLIRKQLPPLFRLQRVSIQRKEAAVFTGENNNPLIAQVSNYRSAADVDIEVGVAVVAVGRHLKEGFILSRLRIEREHSIGKAGTGQFRLKRSATPVAVRFGLLIAGRAIDAI